MKRATVKFLAISTLIVNGLLPSISPAAEPLPVVASFSILGDLVQVVGGERVKVTTLVGPDADAHAFEPKPAHAKTILQSRLFVINGLNFEPWAQKLARSANYKGEILVASQGIKVRKLPLDKDHQHADADPHGWQDPSNVVVYVKNIAKSLASLDPAGASNYQKNSETYIKELEALDQFTKDQLAPLSIKQRQVITSHDAFGYFAARYQIIFLAPQGINADVEPSAKEVAQLIRQIKRDKIKAVFVENMSNPKLLAQITQDTGVTLGPKLYVDALSGPNEPGSTYLKMMHHNVTQLVAGMQRN
ncbi:metal ABC transporter substrate-binding protein [Rhodoferax ferrireducens]|uniref:metal ABC transporter substrate-binding protein n=1 Tax=Rhodoferax ferrireducens TaxID=192843 RepID=UPI00298DF3D7|nr:metal ABC transporter substrate-binding protein [Rhodoferax ferrireducens]WPC68897.1 metal ABC transporter substrate-binding protein [Rhodoferax ferrireducens]